MQILHNFLSPYEHQNTRYQFGLRESTLRDEYSYLVAATPRHTAASDSSDRACFSRASAPDANAR